MSAPDPFPSAVIDLAAFVVDHRARIKTHPDFIRDKLESNELTMSAFDTHVRSALHGWSAALAFRSMARLVSGIVNAGNAMPSGSYWTNAEKDRLGMAVSDFAGASVLGVSALAVRSLAKAVPRRQLSQMKPKEQQAIRELEALRDAKRSGEGFIVPPKDALRRGTAPVPSSALTFVATCATDGSRWKATRLP